MNNPNTSLEIWQVEVNGQIYEAKFEELTQWIAEGALLPQDKVRRGSLRWLEAGRIPLLHDFFNAKELGVAPPVVTATNASRTDEEAQNQNETRAVSQTVTENYARQNFSETAANHFAQQTETASQNFQNFNGYSPETEDLTSNGCSLHPAEEARFVCGDCGKLFCKACPKSYGGTVKICPSCGAICKPAGEFQTARQRAVQYHADLSVGFGFGDFAKALGYPFKFRFSLVSGALLFMFFTIGQNAVAIGGILMVAAAIIASMMANALTFGVLANTVDNMAQGHLSKNFMPDFEDFSLWDDVVHPFFLSIGAYVVSFGLLIVLAVGMIWYVWNMFTAQQQANLNQITRQMKEEKENKNYLNPNLEKNLDQSDLTPEQRQAIEDQEIQEVQSLIQENRKAQLESVVGKSPETKQMETAAMFQHLLKVGVPFVICAFVAFIWGLFYFPAACAVAGYTRSFTATINPVVGLDTIRRLGLDYLKILLMCLIMAVMSAFISGIIAVILSPFDMPGVGNIPSKAVGSLFTFYFSVVFAVTLGYALYKNSAKLNLFRA